MGSKSQDHPWMSRVASSSSILEAYWSWIHLQTHLSIWLHSSVIQAKHLWRMWWVTKLYMGTSAGTWHITKIFYTSNLYWWGKGWPVDGLPFPDTGCPVPDVSIYYMSNINELPDGILFHWFCKCTPPWMFLPLDIPSEYRPEHVTFGLLCVIFKFPSRIFCRRVPGFATDCPCGVWCRGLTTCLLYVGPPLEF